MHEFLKGVGEDFFDTVLELEELVDVYLRRYTKTGRFSYPQI